MKTSKRAQTVTTSLTRKFFNYAKCFDNVIDLTLGDPDFNTPKRIKMAGIQAIKDNRSHYSMNAGVLEARTAVAERIEKDWRCSCNPEENVIITVGGMEALYLALLSIVDQDDEVIVFAPYYVNYVQMIQMCGGKPIILDSYDEQKGMVIDLGMLENSITDKTVAMIINSPNNPTGSILTGESLEIIAKVADKHDLFIISDEVYRTLIYDGIKHQSILQYESAVKRTILIDSLSKEFCMTGWRVGFAYGPSAIIAIMTKFQENVVACANVPSQYALIEAYKGEVTDNNIRREFEQRRDFVCNELSKISGISVVKPQGTFYLFLNISQLQINSEEFAYQLLEQKHIAVVPGKAYGDSFDGYVRISFTKDIETLKRATQAIKEYVQTLSSISRKIL